MLDLNIPELANPNVDLSQDASPALIVTCAVLLPLTWLAVGLRIYVRAYMTKSFQIDDWFMVIAQVRPRVASERQHHSLTSVSQLTFTVVCAIVLEGVRVGLGKHNAALTTENLVLTLKVGYSTMDPRTEMTSRTQRLTPDSGKPYRSQSTS
jgi:hypothetical protein